MSNRLPRLLALLPLSLLLSAALLLSGNRSAVAQSVDCRSSVVYDAATNGSTRLIVGVKTQSVFICGYNLFGGGTATVKLVTGTGTACATDEVAITPAYSLVAQASVPDSSPFWRGLFAAPGLDVCIKTSAGVAIQAIVYYVQK
jgi:hypothetical protein